MSATVSKPERAHARMLVLVHPGSGCGSANFNLGRSLADACRADVARELREWGGDVIVLDGSLSDELGRYPEYAEAIDGAVKRAAKGMRAMACDDVAPHPDTVLPRLIKRGPWKPGQTKVVVTGAWYDPSDQSGCVNGVVDILTELGFEATVSDSAFALPEGD